MIYSGLTETQLSGMGIALTQGGTGLLHIAIQLMPYAIAFVVLTFVFYFIFKLVNRISRGANSRAWEEADRRYKRDKANSYDSWSDYDSDPFR